jgi:hypothetical protein
MPPAARDRQLCLGRVLAFAGLEKRVACLFEGVERELVCCDVERVGVAVEEVRPPFVLLRPEGDRGAIVDGRGGGRVDREGAVAGGT